MFGGSPDLAICENSNVKKDSWSNLGFTYELPQGITYDSDKSKSYLAGEYCFKVLEIEVYKVVILS